MFHGLYIISMNIHVSFLVTCIILYVQPTLCSVTPIVIWHGMGDSGFNSFSMGAFRTILERNIDNVYVHLITLGDSLFQDTLSGFWWNINDQVTEVCARIKSDPELEHGYNAIGFSQGGQFLRAVAQRCPEPQMRNLITIGTPLQGVYGIPHCPEFIVVICHLMEKIVSLFAYISWMQNRQVQMQYWHDPLNEAAYRQYSVFLADINQEQYINPDYKTNFLRLENFVMVKFLNDTMVKPIESQLFGFYKPGQTESVYTLEESELYIKDKLGLKEMDKAGRIHRFSVYGNHLQISDAWIFKYLLKFLT